MANRLPTFAVPTCWLRADALVARDGDPIATWTDSSGNARNFTAAGAARPTYKDDGGSPTGRPYLLFDGANTVMTGPNLDQLITAGAGTVFMIVRPDAVNTAVSPNENQNIAIWGSNTSAQAVGTFLFDTHVGNNQQIINWLHNGTVSAIATMVMTGTNGRFLDGPWGVWHIIVWSYVATATLQVIADNDPPYTHGVAIATGAAGINTASAIGRNYQQTKYYSGAIGEMIFYNAYFNGPQIAQIMDYLRREWQTVVHQVT